jgi:hypothetical protein
MKKKTLVFVAAVATAIGLTVGAYAYFTSSGGGDGSASVGTSSPIEITPTITGTLYPGGPAASVSFTVKNTGSGNEYVDSISYDSLNDPPGNCASSWFELNGGNAVSVAHDVDPGDTYDVPGSYDLKMLNVESSQDDCAGASLSFHFTSS